ncbi:hypothetical protein [Paraburkholderia caballeronis]|uniref:hypothetical protein n=1 Tax=Paraburkholderia caballeronis TaxID=416943 RepID=UPI00106606EF|nr:hypothetical protein [Paraburkholderia caballeronis]
MGIDSDTASETLTSPNFVFRSEPVAIGLMHGSAGFQPASASFWMPLIGSSLDRFFISVPL